MSTVIKTFRKQLNGSAQQLSSTPIYTQSFMIRNEIGNDDVYVGDSTVSTTTGMFVREGESNEKESRPTARGTLTLFDLSKIYVLGTNAQYIRVEYLHEE